MENKKNNSKHLWLIIICVLLLILAVIGISFAAVFYSKTGEKINRVTTGTITMSYSENTNGINLTEAYPTNDDVGMALNQEDQYFDFTVSATTGGNVIIDYVVTATKEADSTLPDNAIKVYLTDMGNGDKQVLAPTKISDLPVTNGSQTTAPDGQYILTTSNFNTTSSRNYRLRMWIASDYKLPEDIRTYKLRVNVYGAVAV